VERKLHFLRALSSGGTSFNVMLKAKMLLLEVMKGAVS